MIKEKQTSSDEADISDGEFKINQLVKPSPDPILVDMQMNGQSVTMEVDTGAALSVISETTKNRTFPKEKLHSTDLILKTYTDEQLKCWEHLI